MIKTLRDLANNKDQQAILAQIAVNRAKSADKKEAIRIFKEHETDILRMLGTTPTESDFEIWKDVFLGWSGNRVAVCRELCDLMIGSLTAAR